MSSPNNDTLTAGAVFELSDEVSALGHASNHHEDRLPDEIVDAAITWSVKLNYNQAAPAVKQAFERWLYADSLHAQAWQRVGILRSDFAQLPALLAMDALRAADKQRRSRQHTRRNTLKLLSLSGVTLILGRTLHDYTPWQRLLADASTGVGEQQMLRLADGTVLMLNTDSAVSTDLTGEGRLIVLRRGEIMITTGADANASNRRPFWVYTPFGRMQALGTRFVVRLDEQRARISVQEGTVQLRPADGGTAAIVHAGESRWLTDDDTTVAESRGFEDDAFAGGVIAGRNIRLGDLLTELSRYRNGRIVCDTRIADLRVSGVFHIKNTDQALQFLVQTQPINVVYRTRFWVTVEPT